MFGERLKKLRIEKEMSQWHLSVKSGVEQSTISLYEHNKTEPTLHSIEALCKALKVPASELLGF